jgi:hypothetical protein
VRPDKEHGVLLELVIGNSGPTIATNVRVRIEPPLPFIEQLEGAKAAQERLAEGMSSCHLEERCDGGWVKAGT